MNRKTDQLIPLAYRAVQENLVAADGRSISKQYNGYIASFGAAVVQSGILAALVFNYREPEDSHSEEDRRKLMDAIYRVICEQDGERVQGADLKAYYRHEQTDKRRLKQQILDAATAIKLVIRTFKLTEPTNANQND